MGSESSTKLDYLVQGKYINDMNDKLTQNFVSEADKVLMLLSNNVK